MSKGPKIAGILFILIGIIIALNISGLITGSIWRSFYLFWPVLLIFAGIALIFKHRWVALSLVALIIFGGILYIANSHGPFQREVVQQISSKSIDTAQFELNFGAGQVHLTSDESGYLATNRILTSDVGDPSLDYSNGKITIGREGFPIFGGKADQYNITLSPDPIYDMQFNYGASDVNLDLRNLKVSDLELNSGASKTDITFGSYPADVDISTGASDIILKFPANMGIKIMVDGGLVDVDASGFKKEENVYYSPNYSSEGNNIDVQVDAGVSKLQAIVY